MKYCPLCLKEYPDNVKNCSEDGTETVGQVSYLLEDPVNMVGNILDKRYKILEILGSGGMGSVFKARHIYLERDVAIKVVRPDLLVMAEIKKRFLREARAISMVAHENIVEILDFGVSETGVYYLVMEYLKGRDLYRYIEEQKTITIDEFLQISLQIARALVEVHAHGFVHRDLKPENIILFEKDSRKNTVKLLDFGIAAIFEENESRQQERLTRSGGALGSPYYMSPEQVMGEKTDPTSDIYSLGCLMFEMLTGQTPFTGKNPVDVLTQHASREPPRLTEKNPLIPSAIEDIVMKCLNKEKEKRYQGAEKLINDITNFIKATTYPYIHTPQPISIAKKSFSFETNADIDSLEVVKAPKRKRKLIASVIASFVVLCAILFFAAGRIGENSQSIATGLSSSVLQKASTGVEIKPKAIPADAVMKKTDQVRPRTEKIHLNIDSNPPGAGVFHGGELKGQTPLSIESDKKKEAVEYSLIKEGYQNEKIQVSLDRDQMIKVTLFAIKKKDEKKEGEKVGGKKKKPVDINVPKDFINPFE
jgi:serine/threonine-protein kinase